MAIKIWGAYESSEAKILKEKYPLMYKMDREKAEDIKMMNYTKAQEKAINDYLTVCIKNNYRCQHCAKNDNGVCFFAFQCFANGMNHFDDGDDDDNDPCEYCEAGICHGCCNDIPDDIDETNYDPYSGCDMYEVDDML